MIKSNFAYHVKPYAENGKECRFSLGESFYQISDEVPPNEKQILLEKIKKYKDLWNF